ncbi:nucleoid-associated protein [Sphingobacterium sp. UBA5980]|uniref:nucleoid-associated protein n=1 Tax=Sphingobacterium sp. UBA5980 TaxID=1947504 RepID=UPI00257DD128|nr:nucleoid-associated protein [Sphingobacterium sp. UBA5980]
MVLSKEKGHNVNLTNIVIHRINKISGSKEASLKIAKSEIQISKPEIKFIAEVRESFNKRSVPTHGVFEDALEYNGFQQAIKSYKENAIDFMQFSIESMRYYQRVIERSVPATGGFIIFADFKITDNNNERYILVLSINNRQGYNLNEVALSIQEIQNLELNKMDLASIVNISRWEAMETNPNIKTYLTFIRGKKKISDYFQDFIGCEDKTTATESSTRLLNTIDRYLQEREYDDKSSKSIKSKILDYCQEANRNKKEILLSRISLIFDEENPEEFLRYATDERFGNSEVIKYDGKTLRSLKYVDFQSEDFTLKFNKKLIGNSVKINKEKTTITITNLPKELIDQF